LVDIANGHIQKLHDLCKKFVKNRKKKNHVLMVGNIANPKTYKELAKIGVDYVRVGIGGGSGCLTSANTGIHYPMASLIHECYEYKKKGGYKTKIVADGGFRNYDDIIKAIMLGADYVMLGGILNKCLESCSTTKIFGVSLSTYWSTYIWYNHKWLRKYMKKSFRGMSTKEVQKKWGRGTIKTSEGIVKTNPVEYTLGQWVENFTDYLKSAMSYTNSKTLKEFRESEFVFITENALKRFNK
jgi:IMP dehydrogenase/GMP reductase